MDDINLGIITVLLCIAGYSFAWKYQSKDKYTIAISLLIISGLILRIYTSADFFLHSWDEMYHALVAKNLIKHPLLPTLYDNPVLPYDFKAWVQNHVWLHKQPFIDETPKPMPFLILEIGNPHSIKSAVLPSLIR